MCIRLVPEAGIAASESAQATASESSKSTQAAKAAEARPTRRALGTKKACRGTADERAGISLNRKVLGLPSLSGNIAGPGCLLLLCLLLLSVSNLKADHRNRDHR
ncbi:MAG: hypothetical protein ABI614_01865 [Planctomycetota bacterium]